MPLHDWSKLPGWEGVHDIWIVELLRWIKPRLPGEFRAHIGTTPTLGIGAAEPRADVAVRSWHTNGTDTHAATVLVEP